MEFWFDVVCPYAYLASTQVEPLAAEAGVSVRWRPVLLGGILRAQQRPDVPEDAMPANKRRLNRADVARRASWLGQPLHWPEAQPRRSVDAMRCLVACDDERVGELAAVLFRAYWVHGLDIAERSVLQQLVQPFGLDVASLCADPGVRDGLRNATDEALARGVFGVPTVVVGEQHVWGVDRLGFVRQALGLGPEAARVGERRGGRLELFHDVASPFSYLGVTQAQRIAAEAGAELVLTPILLGGLFRSIGTPIVPLATFSAERQAWVAHDLDAWAARWGVPFGFPEAFPLRTVTAQRVMIAAPACTEAVYDAVWSAGRDVGDPAVLGRVLDEAGFDSAGLLARASEPAVKGQLRENTERAEAVGVCGVPSWQVDERWLFWGQDRIDQVLAVLSGAWSPGLGHDHGHGEDGAS